MTDIRYLDSLYDKHWEKFLIRSCGLDFEYYWHHEEVLTRDILNSNIDDLVDKILSFEDFVVNPKIRPRNPRFDGSWVLSDDDIHKGFQILGILILQTGGYMPRIVKDSILYSTTWEYDKSRGWAEAFIEERKQNLSKFRNAVINYKEGQKVFIDF